MKNPSFAKFMIKVESTIENLDENRLRNVLMRFAENTDANKRYVLLEQLEASLASVEHGGISNEELVTSPEDLLEEITAFNQRILDGEFFDEELNERAWENEEPSYRRQYDDYDEDIDFSSEEYVLVADDLLDRAKMFYRKKDLDTAYKAYKLLFDIFENPDYYEDDAYFVYNFSFKEAIGSDVLAEHETIYPDPRRTDAREHVEVAEAGLPRHGVCAHVPTAVVGGGAGPIGIKTAGRTDELELDTTDLRGNRGGGPVGVVAVLGEERAPLPLARSALPDHLKRPSRRLHPLPSAVVVHRFPEFLSVPE